MEHKYIVTEFANGSLENVIEAAEKIKIIIEETKSKVIKMGITSCIRHDIFTQSWIYAS